jgi:hypothetical protein
MTRETTLQFLLRPDNLRIMSKIIPLFCLKQQQLYGGWKYIKNILEENNLSYLLIINLLKNWGICILKKLNHLQTALLEHNFIVQYKKGTNMPADYLSRLPSLPVNAFDSLPSIAASDPFQPELQQLQCQDQDRQAIFQLLKHNQWPPSLTKHKIRILATLAPKVFFDKNKLAWIRLGDFQYPRTALWLPECYKKRLSVKLMTAFLQDTMQIKSLILN